MSYSSHPQMPYTNVECEGYEHFQTKCPNFLKRQGKRYVLILFDDDSNENSDLEEDVKAFVSNISSDTSSHDNPDDELDLGSGINDTQPSHLSLSIGFFSINGKMI